MAKHTLKCLRVHTARFLKHDLLFFNIMNGMIKVFYHHQIIPFQRKETDVEHMAIVILQEYR